MQQSVNSKAVNLDIPRLGAGMGYRREISKDILDARDSIDFVEIITDQFINNPRHAEELEQVCQHFQVIPHGVGLSIGSAAPPGRDYLLAIRQISDLTKSPYYSEHLCVTQAPGIDIGHLSPLWLTEQVLKRVIENVSRVQDFLGKPLVLENITYLLSIPHGTVPEPEFFTRLTEATGCGLLLDLTNVHINSVNHKFDPVAYLEKMPLERVVQTHLAGGYWSNGILIDGHSEPVQEESWKLLELLVKKTILKAIIIEHDHNFPEMSVLLQQINRARHLIAGAPPTTASSNE